MLVFGIRPVANNMCPLIKELNLEEFEAIV